MIDAREKDFIKTDEEKRKLIERAGSANDHKGFDAVIVYDHSWGDVEVSGLGNLYNNKIVKILTEKGAAEHTVLRFDYDPKSYINDLIKLRIHRKEGHTEELDVSDYRDVMQPERLLFWRVKMKLYTMPHLKVGDSIEIETFKKGFNVAYLKSAGETEGSADFDPETWVDPETGIKPPMYGAFFDIVYFREKVPVKEKRYTLLSPKNMPLSYEFYHGDCRASCVIDDEYYTYSWEKKDIEGYKPEARMPGIETSMPKLLISSIHNWKEKSRWFYKANVNQFEWNEEIKKVVDEVTAPFDTDDEKAAALLHWVAQEIRYIGFSIYKGEGYTLHPGIMTFDERGGVCKDLAGMLVTMLRAAGYESYPAQTQALDPVERIPADQFNHCVTAWKKPDGTWQMLDPTWAPFSMDIWDAAETKQNYLIGTPEGEEIGTIREFKPEDSLMKITATSRLHENGALKGHVNYWGKGRSDSTQRFMKEWRPRVTFDRTHQKLVAEIDPAAEMTDLKTGDADDLLNNYQTDIDYRADKYAVQQNGEIQFRIPMARFMRNPIIARYLTMADTPERKFDLLVIFLQLVDVEETIEIPRGYKLVSKELNVDIEQQSADYQASLKQENGRLTFKSVFNLKVRYITKDEYKNFKELTDKARETAERWFTLRKID